MQNSFFPSTSDGFQEVTEGNADREEIRQRMHILANKLLPITVFAQLALRHCKDPQIINHLEKINYAAEEARVIVAEIQHLKQMSLASSMAETIPNESK